MNLIRGTSTHGATSLIKHQKTFMNIHFLRPLIQINRHYIYFICKKLCLPIWSDSSNLNLNIYRNRIRYELIPYLKNFFNIQIEKNIEKFLNICYEDNEYIKQNVLKLYKCIIINI